MTTNNILQQLDVNNSDMDKSPARVPKSRFSKRSLLLEYLLDRKRARYDIPTKENWSLSYSNVQLDEVFDSGVALLESDSDTHTDEEFVKVTGKIPSNTKTSSSGDLSQSDKIEKHQFPKLSMKEWQDFLIKRVIANVDSDTDIDYFSLLSDEVILHIFHFLPKKQLIEISYVCRRFLRLTKDESLWTRMDVAHRVLKPGAIGYILSRQVVVLRLAQSEIPYPPIFPDCRASNDEFQSRLLYLDLSMVHITIPSLVKFLSKCRRLKKVSLEHVTVNEDVLYMLGHNTELEVLNLTMAEGIDLAGIKYVMRGCRKLRELNISWTFLGSATINYICANLPKTVDRINLSGCRKMLTDANVCNLVHSCPGLRELDLSDCTGLTGDVINHIVLLDELNFLALSRCYLVPYRALLSLKKISSLIYLDLHGGYIDANELKIIQETLGSVVHINKFKFSSVARPTVGQKKSSIWNLRVRD